MTLRRETGDLPSTNTYDAVIAAARELFREDGFQNVTVEMICKAARVGRSSYYFYFKNKTACFAAVSDSIMGELYGLSGERYPEAGAFEKIVYANATFLILWLREPKILSDYFALSLVDDQLRETYERNKERFEIRLEARLRRMMERGEIQETEPRLLVVCLHSMIQLFFRYLSSNAPRLQEYTMADALRVVSEAWYRTIYGRPAPLGFPYAEHLASLVPTQSTPELTT